MNDSGYWSNSCKSFASNIPTLLESEVALYRMDSSTPSSSSNCFFPLTFFCPFVVRGTNPASAHGDMTREELSKKELNTEEEEQANICIFVRVVQILKMEY